MKSLPKIFADFNNIDQQGRVRLTNGSFDELNRQQIEPREGLKVLLDDNSEFIIEGILEFSNTEGCWVAEFNSKDLRTRDD